MTTLRHCWLRIVGVIQHPWFLLTIGLLIVLGATFVGWWHTRDDSANWAPVVILGVTALVVVCYAHQARRTADETRRMAIGTHKLVHGSLYPVVRIITRGRPTDGPVINEIKNRGTGPALDVRITVGEGGRYSKVVSDILMPGQTTPAPDAIVPTPQGETVWMTWADILHNHYGYEYVYRESTNTWLAMEADASDVEGRNKRRRQFGLPPITDKDIDL